MATSKKEAQSWKLLLLAEDGKSKREYNYVSVALAGLAKLIRSSVPVDIMVATDALGSVWFSSTESPPIALNQTLNHTPLFKTRNFTISNIANIVESTILPPSWTLAQTTASILVDPLNIYRFPILNILNSFEYMAISIFWKGYDYIWDTNVHENESKDKIITERFERVVAAFCIVLVSIIREYKHHHIYARDLISKILQRLESFLGAESDYRNLKNFPDNIKPILSYLKSEAWPQKDTLSFIGSVYDVILGEEVMTLLNDLMKEEYIFLLKLARGPKRAITRQTDNTNISLQETFDDETKLETFIRSRQITLENFKVYKHHPFYVIWNFLTLMAGVRTCPTTKTGSGSAAGTPSIVSGRLSRYIVTTLLRLDMVPLLMCPICSSGLDQKLRSIRKIYKDIVDKDKIKVKSVLEKFSIILPQDWRSDEDIALENILHYLLKRKWQDADAPTGIQGARLILQKKSAALLTSISDDLKRSFKIQHDLYSFLSFYLLFISSQTENIVNFKRDSHTTSLPLLGTISATKLKTKSPIRSLYESQDNCWLLALVGIWALRNAIRIGNFAEPYPLINFLSGLSSDGKSGEHFMNRVLNHPFVREISLQNLEFAFAEYSEKYRVSSNYIQEDDDEEQQERINSSNSTQKLNVKGIYVMSKKYLKQMSINDLLDMEKFPLTEYEINQD
uniref:Wsv327-like protein n=1 Tax=Melicertus latisulcatus majanivirus TaxID=2984277 RepID=A0A9C7BM65_9VIRU|nr:MAG: wsv327-like protein [Melicertus latisulcatus majanivirus]